MPVDMRYAKNYLLKKNEQVMMQEPTHSSDPSFLMRADESAQRAWASSVKDTVPDPVERELLVGALKHPFLRHLMELYLNNSVTSLGASILLHRRLAEVHEVKGRADWCRGCPYGTVELTKSAKLFFKRLRDRNEDKPWFDTLLYGLTDYACRDAGEGICLGREHLVSAIENNDVAILQRVVEPRATDYCFPEIESLDLFTDEARLATEAFWSPHFEGRRSAKVFTSTFEYSRPQWSLQDEEDAQDFRISSDF